MSARDGTLEDMYSQRVGYAVQLHCGTCRRALRRVTLTPPDRLLVLGGVSPEGRSGELAPNGGRSSTPDERRAADCFDASPWGWSAGQGLEPSHYRFVCRHKNGRHMMKRLSVDQLREMYRDAVMKDLEAGALRVFIG